jgi:hypothetical protein
MKIAVLTTHDSRPIRMEVAYVRQLSNKYVYLSNGMRKKKGVIGKGPSPAGAWSVALCHLNDPYVQQFINRLTTE